MLLLRHPGDEDTSRSGNLHLCAGLPAAAGWRNLQRQGTPRSDEIFGTGSDGHRLPLQAGNTGKLPAAKIRACRGRKIPLFIVPRHIVGVGRNPFVCHSSVCIGHLATP